MNLGEAKIHFIGIGGIGMSGIAEVLVNIGCRVTGSDLSENSQVGRLRGLGVKIHTGHKPENVPDPCDAVVYSSAVSPTNPEVRAARRRHIPVIQRAEMLAELMRLKRGIAIGGTHGKTTTTSLVASVMLHAHLDPTIVVGGRLDLIKSTAALGRGPWLLVEADESDGSFLRLSPEIIVITNVDNDHLQHYGNFANLEKAFEEFARKIPFYGRAILCIDDRNVFKLARKFDRRMLTYGFHKKARLRAHSLVSQGPSQTFHVELDGIQLGKIHLHIPGRHNVQNSLAAIGVGLELGIDFKSIGEGVAAFTGVDRRLQAVGEFNGSLLLDDYGHHPTEVEATLQALKQAYPHRRIVVAFQPHRFSRTSDCWNQFVKCFNKADCVGFLDIYPAGEKPLVGINSQKLAKAVARNKKNIFYWGNRRSALSAARLFLKPDDVFLTLGAGDVWKVGRDLAENPKT